MKKVYVFLALAVLTSTMASAQVVQKILNTGRKTQSVQTHSNALPRMGNPTGSNHTAATIWSDDFSLPANWAITHTPGTNSDWVIGVNPPSGLYPIDPINSETALNGFALFDSDGLCDTINGQVAQLTTVNPIDLTGHNYVRLTFSQYYRRFHDSTYVYISNDNTNWTRFEVNATLGDLDFNQNNINVNPDVVDIDISSIAANQATVYVRFEFYSPIVNATDTDSIAGCAYSWMIDDVSINDIFSTDAKIVRPAFNGEYICLPKNQREGFQLRGKVLNYGYMPLSGAMIGFDVFSYDGANFNYLFSDTSAASGTVNPGDTSGWLSATLNGSLPDTGTYYVQQAIMLQNDSATNNDSAVAIVFVDDSMYARDYTFLNTSSFAGAFGGNSANFYFGQMFHIYQASQITSASAYLLGPTVGDHIKFNIYNVVGGVPGTIVASTPVYQITQLDTPQGLITIPFSSPVFVNADDYFVAINQIDINNMGLGTASEISTPGTVFYKTGAAITWTSFPNTLMLRVNNPSSTFVGINNAEANSQFNVFPNPSTGMIFIAGDGKTEKNVAVTVISPLGQIVKSVKYDSFVNDRLDLSDFPAGLYTIKFSTSKGVESKTIVLE